MKSSTELKPWLPSSSNIADELTDYLLNPRDYSGEHRVINIPQTSEQNSAPRNQLVLPTTKRVNGRLILEIAEKPFLERVADFNYLSKSQVAPSRNQFETDEEYKRRLPTKLNPSKITYFELGTRYSYDVSRRILSVFGGAVSPELTWKEESRNGFEKTLDNLFGGKNFKATISEYPERFIPVFSGRTSICHSFSNDGESCISKNPVLLDESLSLFSNMFSEKIKITQEKIDSDYYGIGKMQRVACNCPSLKLDISIEPQIAKANADDLRILLGIGLYEKSKCNIMECIWKSPRSNNTLYDCFSGKFNSINVVNKKTNTQLAVVRYG